MGNSSCQLIATTTPGAAAAAAAGVRCVAQITQTTACFDRVKITTSKACNLWSGLGNERQLCPISIVCKKKQVGSLTQFLEMVQRPSFQHQLINSAPVQHSLIQKIASCRDYQVSTKKTPKPPDQPIFLYKNQK